MSKVARTSIEWADYTVNPIRALATQEPGRDHTGWHCERVSEGCANCYSAALNKRFGTGLDYAADQTRKVAFRLDEVAMSSMLTFKPKGPFKNGRSRSAVFPFDMTDLFGQWVSDEWLDRVFAIFAQRPDVDWLVLTKRAERMREYVVDSEWKLSNVWLGVSAENHARADERIPDLLATPAAVRFVSAEPLLGPVYLGHEAEPPRMPSLERSGHRRLDWVIVGGESGRMARPCDVSWVRSIIEQCKAAEVPCFVKQLGSRPLIHCQGCENCEPGREETAEAKLSDRKGGDPEEWPEDLRVREMPR